MDDFTIFTSFCLLNRCVFDSFCYWFLIKFLKLAIITRVFQLIFVKLLIVFIIIRQDAPLGISGRANLYATVGL